MIAIDYRLLQVSCLYVAHKRFLLDGLVAIQPTANDTIFAASFEFNFVLVLQMIGDARECFVAWSAPPALDRAQYIFRSWFAAVVYFIPDRKVDLIAENESVNDKREIE